MKAFAIRLRGTDKYMPRHPVGRRGFSYDEPVENGGQLGPRLFTTRLGARNAITAWRRGTFEATTVYSDFDVDYQLKVRAVKGRETTDLEVVEFDLVERPQ